MLADGALTLTTVRLLAPHLTDDNHDTLLAEASGKGKRAVEELLVRHFPKAAVPSSIRKLPAPEPTRLPVEAVPVIDVVEEPGTLRSVVGSVEGGGMQGVVGGGPAVTLPSGGTTTTLLSGTAAAVAPTREVMRPLSPDRYEIRFTATAATCEKLRLAKDLLRHAVPDGDLAAIVDRALDVFLEDLARKKYAATPRPRAAQAESATRPADSRHVPAGVKRTVWLRDGGRCAYVGKPGRRCAARGFLEFHHVRPYAVGGLATPENIQIRCRAHNAYEADLFYRRPEEESPAPDPAANSFRNESVDTQGNPKSGSPEDDPQPERTLTRRQTVTEREP